MTSLSDIDLDSVSREIAAPPPPPEPSPELIAKAGAYLERRGWTRELAGEADFAAASLALARCSLDGLPGGANPPGEPRLDGDVSPHPQPARSRGTFARLDGDVSPHLQPARRRGIFAFGRYGCGKTALLKAIRPLFEPVHFVPLNDPDYAELMDAELWPNWNADAIRCSVMLDDLGAESAITDYGIKREPAAEFVVRYHRARMSSPGGGARLFVTTNLTGEELAERYTARLTSRLKELCLPLHLKGADKRRWNVSHGAAESAERVAAPRGRNGHGASKEGGAA